MKQNKSNTKSNSTRYPNNILPHRTPEAVGWITAEIMISYRTSLPVRFLFVPESRNSQIQKWWAACSDFGKRLEVLELLLENLRFFSHPASMQGVKKKGRV